MRAAPRCWPFDGAVPRRPRRALAVAALALLAAIAPTAAWFDASIDAAAVDQAIALGRTPGSPDLSRFHQQYVIGLGGPMLDRLEIITEFRRVVLATEEHARLADIGWGARDAERMLRPWRDKITLVLHVTFPPNNTYREMPPLGIVLYARPGSGGPGRMEPIDLRATPRYISGQPAPAGTPILGGRVDATFDARALDPHGIYLAGIDMDRREVRRVEVNFARVR